MFSFSASADKATIKPIDKKTDQITFHNMQSITFISHHPEVTAGSMGMEKFVKEIWNDNSKANIAIAGIASCGPAKKIHVFEASNPRYDVATKDFALDIVGFCNKTKAGFKADGEIELNDVSLWISGLTMGKQKAETVALRLSDRAGLPNIKNLALVSDSRILIKEGDNVLIENQNEMLSHAKPLGTVSEVQAIGHVNFPPIDPAIVEVKTSEMPPEFREFIDSKVVDTAATPVVGSHWWGG